MFNNPLYCKPEIAFSLNDNAIKDLSDNATKDLSDDAIKDLNDDAIMEIQYHDTKDTEQLID